PVAKQFLCCRAERHQPHVAGAWNMLRPIYGNRAYFFVFLEQLRPIRNDDELVRYGQIALHHALEKPNIIRDVDVVRREFGVRLVPEVCRYREAHAGTAIKMRYGNSYPMASRSIFQPSRADSNSSLERA